MAEGQREKQGFADSQEDWGDAGDGEGLFEGLGFTFGEGDEEEPAKGTYLEHFSAPDAATYERLAANRSVVLAIQRSTGCGLVASPALGDFVNGVLRRIVKASPVPALDARALVRAEPGFEAYSTPDGSIYVNVGLLLDIGSEDELAAVLAHELAHILYRHHGSDWFANSQKIAAQVLSLADYAEGFLDGVLPSKDSKKVLYTALASEISERVIAPNLWNREQEREADGLGLDLLVAAGYRSSAATSSLERLATYEEKMRARSRRQLEEVAESAQADMNEAVQEGDLSKIVVGLIEGAGKVMGVAANAAIHAVGGGNHDPAEVRLERLDAYINREHLFAPRPPLAALPWQTPNHPSAAVLANYRAARKASAALASGRIDEAESLIRAAVGAPTTADAYPRLVFSELRARQGDLPKSYRNLEIAADGPEPSFAVYQLMIEEQLTGGRADEAVRLVDKAVRRLDEPPNLFPYQIGVLVGAKKNVEALALFTKCKLSYPDLAPDCNRALGGLRSVAADESADRSATDQLIDRQVDKTGKKVTTGLGKQ